MQVPKPRGPSAPRRVLLHAGFHKTGTSTLQDCLRENGDLLAPLWRVETLLHNPLLRATTEAARAYSLGRDPADLGLFQAALVPWLAQMDLTPGQGLMISSEDFAGHMPGIGQVRDYRALGPVLAAFVDLAGRYFDGEVAFGFVITTRARDPWMRSLHWQQAKGNQQKLDFADFAARLPQAADHASVASAARDMVAPWPLDIIALEAVQARRLGPAEALFDLADLPTDLRARLRPVAPRNIAPAANLAAEFVALNRLGLDPDDLKRRKDALRRAAVPPAGLLR